MTGFLFFGRTYPLMQIESKSCVSREIVLHVNNKLSGFSATQTKAAFF